MAFFFLRMSHLKIHSVFLLQFFISSTFYLRCIKLATQSCSSELVRLVALFIQFPGNGHIRNYSYCFRYMFIDHSLSWIFYLYMYALPFFVKHLLKIILCYCVLWYWAEDWQTWRYSESYSARYFKGSKLFQGASSSSSCERTNKRSFGSSIM